MYQSKKWIGYLSDFNNVPFAVNIHKKLYNGIYEYITNINDIHDKFDIKYIDEYRLEHINFSIKYAPGVDAYRGYGIYLKEIIMNYFNQDVCGNVHITYLHTIVDYSLGITTFYPYISIPILPESNNEEVNVLVINNTWDINSDTYFTKKSGTVKEVPWYGNTKNARIPIFGEILDWRLLSNNPLSLLSIINDPVMMRVKYWKGLFLIPIGDNEDIKSLNNNIIQDVKLKVKTMELNRYFIVKLHITLNNDDKIISELCEMFDYKIISYIKIDIHKWMVIQCPSLSAYADIAFFNDSLANLVDNRPITAYYNCNTCNDTSENYVQAKYALELANNDVLDGKYANYIDVLSSGILTFPVFSSMQFDIMIKRFKIHYNKDLTIVINKNSPSDDGSWYPIICRDHVFAWIKDKNEKNNLQKDINFEENKNLISLGNVIKTTDGITVNFPSLKSNYLFYKSNGTISAWKDGDYLSIWGKEYYNLTRKVSAIAVV